MIVGPIEQDTRGSNEMTRFGLKDGINPVDAIWPAQDKLGPWRSALRFGRTLEYQYVALGRSELWSYVHLRLGAPMLAENKV